MRAATPKVSSTWLGRVQDGFDFSEEIRALSATALLTLPFGGKLAKNTLCFSKVGLCLRLMMRVLTINGCCLSHVPNIFQIEIISMPKSTRNFPSPKINCAFSGRREIIFQQLRFAGS